jgi:hypothetical protein
MNIRGLNVYRSYLRFMLRLASGLTAHVNRMSDRWCTINGDVRKLGATWDATEMLVEHHGYHACPVCRWATRTEGEHLRPGMWCYDENYYAEHGHYPDEPQLGEELAMT